LTHNNEMNYLYELKQTLLQDIDITFQTTELNNISKPHLKSLHTSFKNYSMFLLKLYLPQEDYKKLEELKLQK